MEAAKESEIKAKVEEPSEPQDAVEEKEDKVDGPVKPKHDQLVEDDPTQTTTHVELIQNKFTENVTSPFISKSNIWEDKEVFDMPEDLLSNIVNELGFKKPSIIQSVSIPMIARPPYNALIAQARNGAGKTGSFAIGSTLRVDRDDPRTQVLCIVHTRELCNQIASVYERITKGTGITLANFTEKVQPA